MTNTKLQKLKQLSRHKCDNPGKWGVPPLTTDYARFFCRNFAPEFMAPPPKYLAKIHSWENTCLHEYDRSMGHKEEQQKTKTDRKTVQHQEQ